MLFKSRLGINPNEITLYLHCTVGMCERHDFETFVVGISIPEYLSLNIEGDVSEFFWDLKHKQELVNSRPPQITNTGMDTRNAWRHAEYVEEVKTGSNKYLLENTRMTEFYYTVMTEKGEVFSGQVMATDKNNAVEIMTKCFMRLGIDVKNMLGPYSEEELKSVNDNNIKQNTNMNNEVTRINETQLKNIVSECIKKIVAESKTFKDGKKPGFGKKNAGARPKPQKQWDSEENDTKGYRIKHMCESELCEFITEATLRVLQNLRK